MSVRQNITYNQIINRVVDWIKSNCTNIDGRYDSVLPANAKNGWAYNVVNYSWSTPHVATTLWCGATLNTPLTKITSAVLNNEVTAFCNAIGLTSTARNYNIDDRNFILFLEDISIFMTTKLAFVIISNTAGLGGPGSSSTTSGNNRQCVYMPNALPTNNLVQLISPSNNATEYTTKMSDMIVALNNLFATVKSQIRTVQSTFVFS